MPVLVPKKDRFGFLQSVVTRPAGKNISRCLIKFEVKISEDQFMDSVGFITKSRSKSEWLRSQMFFLDITSIGKFDGGGSGSG